MSFTQPKRIPISFPQGPHLEEAMVLCRMRIFKGAAKYKSRLKKWRDNNQNRITNIKVGDHVVGEAMPCDVRYHRLHKGWSKLSIVKWTGATNDIHADHTKVHLACSVVGPFPVNHVKPTPSAIAD